MDTREQLIKYYQDKQGNSPFKKWLSSLRDLRVIQRIEARLGNLQLGNFGVSRSVGQGVMELKVDVGPGYRVYYGRDGESLVLLLTGGDKGTQSKDVAKAHEYWNDYKSCKKIKGRSEE